MPPLWLCFRVDREASTGTTTRGFAHSDHMLVFIGPIPHRISMQPRVLFPSPAEGTGIRRIEPSEAAVSAVSVREVPRTIGHYVRITR